MTADFGTPLGPGAEFDLIRALIGRWGPLAVGIGDDAAVVDLPRGERLVVSTDAAVEHVHFRREWLSVPEIGYRAVAAALSDLAAMAATPRGVLISLVVADPAASELAQLADGIGEAVRDAGTVVRGGNVARGHELGITTTVLGSVYAPLTRSGARPGDVLAVTGALGGPAAALRALRSGTAPAEPVRSRFVRPRPRLAEARWLAARGAVACVDLSDGLAGDASHLAAASAVGLEVEVERVPVFAGASGDDALAGGEEYELLIASRAPIDDAAFAERFGIPLTVIGRVTERDSGIRFTRAGRRVAAPRAYDHFSG
jgi:thiamine-monophosphate kinase